MNEQITKHLNEIFAPYDGVKSVAELKEDLHADLQERFCELKAQGKDDETALTMTMDSIGDIHETVQEVATFSRSLERQVRINLSARNLKESDFAGVVSHHGKFKSSVLSGTDFTGADLTGSLFSSCSARDADFAGANLTDSSFTSCSARDVNFTAAILIDSSFTSCSMHGANFDGANLTNCVISSTDLSEATFCQSFLTRTTVKASNLKPGFPPKHNEATPRNA